MLLFLSAVGPGLRPLFGKTADRTATEHNKNQVAGAKFSVPDSAPILFTPVTKNVGSPLEGEVHPAVLRQVCIPPAKSTSQTLPY